MKPETIMWLFPIMFMLHDFEEILLMKAWGTRYTFLLNDKLPTRFRKLSNRTLNLSTAGFAFAVMILFLTVSVLTFCCVEWNLYGLWLAALLVYFIHLIMHLGQSLFLKIYVPAVISSVLTGVYSIFAFWYGLTTFPVDLARIGLGMLICLAVLVPVLIIAVILATRFDAWRGRYGQEVSE